MHRTARAFAAAVLLVGGLAVFGSPAGASPYDTCMEGATVSAGVPDPIGLLPGGLLPAPATPLSALTTGPSCTVRVDPPPASVEATLLVTSLTGVLSGQIVIDSYQWNGVPVEQTFTCGPALTGCERTVYVNSAGPVTARCSVQGVVGAETTVECSLRSL